MKFLKDLEGKCKVVDATKIQGGATVSKDEAEKMKAALEDAGAEVELK